MRGLEAKPLRLSSPREDSAVANIEVCKAAVENACVRTLIGTLACQQSQMSEVMPYKQASSTHVWQEKPRGFLLQDLHSTDCNDWSDQVVPVRQLHSHIANSLDR